MARKIMLIILFLIPSLVEGQDFQSRQKDRRMILSLGTGFSRYLGDLEPKLSFKETHLNLNSGLQYRLFPHFLLRGEIVHYSISGNDNNAPQESGRQERNLSFRSRNWEVNFSVLITLFPVNHRFYLRKPINPYFFTGIGGTHFNPKANYQDKWHTLQPLETEGIKYNRTTTVIPIGAGLKIKVHPYLNISSEIGYRYVYTDYLDDVSSTYPGVEYFQENQLAGALSDRGPELNLSPAPKGKVRGNSITENNSFFSNYKDSYLLFQVKIEYFIPAGFKWKKDFNRKAQGTKKRLTY
ncbi:DUF6089 family protein [Xanthovirga aplysinae]|uniref:DUF6089 family protein n=1 Tax=Xanthovirga aplysinae TaxID=2529853 RepID=UPI0012BB5DA2|nr:DUF6089 family protein [Xanthovirga aplysinae]MTI30680.1 hypothetical protein [Xanthovirga aplysinae]